MDIKKMKKAEVAIYHFLETNHIDYYYVASDCTYLFNGFNASGEIYSFLIDASHEESFTVTVSSLFAIKPNSDEYYRALQLLNKLCFLPGFENSTFAIDESGVFVHMQKVDCQGIELTEEYLKKVIFTPLTEFRLLAPAIKKFVFEGQNLDLELLIAEGFIEALMEIKDALDE